MRCGFSPCPRNGASCKTKWHQIIPDYKKIADFFARTGRNGADYWDMTASERKNEGLPHCFAKDLFYSIHEWFGSRPSMQPPHTRDLLSHEDGNFNIHRQQPASEQDVQDNDPISEDPMDIADEMEASDDTNGHTHYPRQAPSIGTPPILLQPAANGAPNSCPRSTLPAGVTPVIISSSEASECSAG